MSETASKWLSYLLSDTSPEGASPSSNMDAVDVLIPGLDAFSLGATSTGCAMHQEKTTLIACYAASRGHVQLVLAQTAHIRKLASENHNRVIYAIVGAADGDAAAASVELVPTDDRILLAGARELERKSDPQWKAYLQEARLLEFVPSSKSSDLGTWLLPSSGDACLNAVPSVPADQRSALEWKEAVNAQPRDALKLGAAPSNPPLDRLGGESAILPSDSLHVSVMQRRIEWVPTNQPDGFYHPNATSVWSLLGQAAMPSWAVATRCSNMAAALTPLPVRLDLGSSLADMQCDVSLTLQSLVSKTPLRVDSMRGVVGPVVVAGRGDATPMRVVEWTSPAAPSNRVLMLLPETYVRVVLADYEASDATPIQWLYTVVCVDNASVIELCPDGRCQEEAEDFVRCRGARLWRLPPKPADVASCIDAVQRAGSATRTLRFRTQQEAAQAASVDDARVRSPTHTIFRTVTTSADPFSGLRVRWTPASDKSGPHILEADTREGGSQLVNEGVVAR